MAKEKGTVKELELEVSVNLKDFEEKELTVSSEKGSESKADEIKIEYSTGDLDSEQLDLSLPLVFELPLLQPVPLQLVLKQRRILSVILLRAEPLIFPLAP